MKKTHIFTLLTLFFAFLLVFTVSSCAGSKKKSQDKIKNAEEQDLSAQEEQTLTTDEVAKNQRVDEYTGWIYIPEKDFSIVNGDVKLRLNGNNGTFCIYAVPEVGEAVPLFSTYDLFSSTFFTLKIGRKEYKLNKSSGIKSEARRTPYGGQMAYTIEKKAILVVDFSFLPSIVTSSRVDMLRVTVYTINTGKSMQAFSVKGVFDTVLGENTTAHFSTAAQSKVNSEKQYMSMEKDLWIRSQNTKAAIQFLLEGKGITAPEYVTLSSKDTLESPRWVPVVQDERSFNSVLTLNNSAMAINWRTMHIDPLKSDAITFYISVASGENEPAGKDFLAALEQGKTAFSSGVPDFVAQNQDTPLPTQLTNEDIATRYRENMPPIATSGREFEPPANEYDDDGLTVYVAPVAEASDVPIPTTSSADTAQVVITKEKLDYSYIQRLLDRIASLEDDPSQVNKAELSYLNRELDAIMAELEARK